MLRIIYFYMYVIHFDFQSVSLSPTRIDALKDVYIVGTNVSNHYSKPRL
jgi:hypothetical protein